MDKPVITGIGPCKKFDQKIALLKSTVTRDRSRSPISGDTCEEDDINDMYHTSPSSPTPSAIQTTPPRPSPPPSPSHRWAVFT